MRKKILIPSLMSQKQIAKYFSVSTKFKEDIFLPEHLFTSYEFKLLSRYAKGHGINFDISTIDSAPVNKCRLILRDKQKHIFHMLFNWDDVDYAFEKAVEKLSLYVPNKYYSVLKEKIKSNTVVKI